MTANKKVSKTESSKNELPFDAAALETLIETAVAKNGEKRPKLELSEVLGLIEEVELTPEVIDALLDFIERRGLEVIDESGEAQFDYDIEEAFDAMISGLEEEETSITKRRAARHHEFGALQGLSTSIDTEDSIRAYMHEISRAPLLTRQEEHDLFELIKKGEQARAKFEELAERGEVATMPNRERRRIRRAISDGENAKNRVIRSNLRLVVWKARPYAGTRSYLDCIQEGNIGLIGAIERFDHKRGYKLSTYASSAIQQAMSRGASEQGKTIRIPSREIGKIRQLKKFESSYLSKHGHSPNGEQIFEALGFDAAEIERIRHYARLEPDRLEKMIADGEHELGSLIQDHKAVNPAENAAMSGLGHDLSTAMASLSEKEAQVIMMRYGLGSYSRAYTLEEVAREFSVSRDRIRQIEVRTIGKLRAPEVSRPLRPYYES